MFREEEALLTALLKADEGREEALVDADELADEE